MNPRLVKEADTLAEAGYSVYVIAADFSPWARDADRCFSGRSWQVAQTIPFGPYSPQRARRVVQVLRQRLARALVVGGVRHPAAVRAAWHPIAPDLVRAALAVRADLYIAHYPTALPAAAIAAQHYQARYAYDAEDFYLGDLPDRPEHEIERRMVRAIEASYLPGCAYVTAASPGIADAYEEAYGIPRPSVLLNVFPRSEAPSGPSPLGTATPVPSLYWFSQTIGPDRGLECAVRAIGLARTRPHLYLRGTPASGFLDHLRGIAAAADAGERLHVLPPAAPSEMVRLAADYDVGLVSETGHTASRRIALTNKQFTYLLAGLPIVMSDIPAHCRIAPDMVKAALLYQIDEPAALAATLDSLLGDPRTLAAARRVAWRLGQERFNWDVEKTRFLDCVKTAVGAGLTYGSRARRGDGGVLRLPQSLSKLRESSNAASAPHMESMYWELAQSPNPKKVDDGIK